MPSETCHALIVLAFFFVRQSVSPMAPSRTCLRLAGNPLLRDAFLCQKPSGPSYFRPVRPYSTSQKPAKPRPYTDPVKPRPLVGTRTPASPSSILTNSPNARPPPYAKPESRGVVAPYWRIALGVVFCSALTYSMVFLLPSSFIPKLTYMHASSPPPSNSKLPPSQIETPSQSANPA